MMLNKSQKFLYQLSYFLSISYRIIILRKKTSQNRQMKERSINELFRSVQRHSNRKQPLPMPPLMTVAHKNIPLDDEKSVSDRDPELDRNHNTLKDSIIESMVEQTSKSEKQDHPFNTHKETLNKFFRASPQKKHPQKQLNKELSFSDRPTGEKVPPLESLIPISHAEPPSNSISLENTRFRQQNNNPMIRIVTDEDTPEKRELHVSDFAAMALQIYDSVVLQKKNEAVPLHQKPIKQILKNILTNASKMELYLCYLQEKANSVALKKHFSSNIQTKQEIENQEPSYSRSRISQNLNSSTRSSPEKKKVVKKKEKDELKSLQLLSCLLVKIRECSKKYEQTVPQVCVRGQDLQIRFTPTKEVGNNQLLKNKQKISQLEETLQKKDEFIHAIKHEYDKIINNYANSLVNMQKEQKNVEQKGSESAEVFETPDFMKIPDSTHGPNPKSRNSLVSGQRLSVGSFQLKRKHTFGARPFRQSNSSSQYVLK